MRRAVPILVIVVGAFALAFRLRSNSSSPTSAEDRITKLRKLVVDQEEESAKAVANYRPKMQARIDDLNISVADLLRNLPGVVQVDVQNS